MTEATARGEQLALLGRTAEAIEDLLLSGATTASEATGRTLSAAFEQASKAGFLRLGSTLRILVEELRRLQENPQAFSGPRLAFFLDRAWLLARATAQAIDSGDAEALRRLTSAGPPPQPLPSAEAACVGVLRRHVPGAFSAFEFRLRLLSPARSPAGAELPAGSALLWSLVVPARADQSIAPEAHLALTQKQGFMAGDMLKHRRIVIEQAAFSTAPPARLMLGPPSKISFGEPVGDWSELIDWNPADWLQRLQGHRPDPLELPIEQAEEVLLRDWSLVEPFAASGAAGRDPNERGATIQAHGICWRIRVDGGNEHLEKAVLSAASADVRPALLASAHVEQGQAVLLPLSLIADKPDYCTIAQTHVGKAELVRALGRGGA
ncbi:MAG: hypothetical protein KDI51_02420 [Xanthomonadales bacterium]|nr:hypothetical protein [Xanthomonadales bacterium]MCB1633412.1 hypothetical protein [Xanthomonadales bacterium]